MNEKIFEACQGALPGWRDRVSGDFTFEAPKGFSSYTLSIRAIGEATPAGIFYRRLAGKKNAILSFAAEKDVFLTLGREGIAAHCLHYDEEARFEELFDGRSLRAAELFEPETLRSIANQLHRLHQLRPASLPAESFFELLHEKWGRLAKSVIEERRNELPPDERALCDELTEIYSDGTFRKVQRCLPEGPLVFCHNDTYHGNIMRLATGEIRLLDFEFSCLNHPAYDFSNLFAETVMEHQQPQAPFFRIVEPRYSDTDLSTLIGFYLDNEKFDHPEARDKEHQRLLRATQDTLLLSDYTYAMAALTLALAPIQKIRFIPYAHQRFTKFLRATDAQAG